MHRLLRALILGGAPTELTAERAYDLISGLTGGGVDASGVGDGAHLRHPPADVMLDRLTARITRMVKESQTTLTRVFGIGPINAAVILAEVANIDRFPSRGHLASYAGTAPIEVSSGDRVRHRLSRSGNRRLNKTIHIAAVVQIRFDTPGRAYYRRKLAEGKSSREALRCLKRQITDAMWRQLQVDRQDDQAQDDTWPRRRATRRGGPTYKSPQTLRRKGPGI